MGGQKSRKHMGLHGRLIVKMGTAVFVDSKSKFTQGIHRLVCIFSKETAIIFRKSHIQNPLHRLNFPMLLCKFNQLFGTSIPAGDGMAGLPAVMSTSFYAPPNGENRLQSRPLLFQFPPIELTSLSTHRWAGKSYYIGIDTCSIPRCRCFSTCQLPTFISSSEKSLSILFVEQIRS